jgi:ribonuclease J
MARCDGFHREGQDWVDENPVGDGDQGYDNCRRVVHEATGRLVVADFAPRNIERLEIFARVAEETSRRLLVQPKDAYLLRAVHLADPRSPDLMASPHIAVYDDPKGVYRKHEAAVRGR